MLRALAALLALVLLVLVGMNFLAVSNLRDEVAALRAKVEGARAPVSPAPPAAETLFDVETPAFGGEGVAVVPQAVPLVAGAPVRKALLALTEIVGADGTRAPVAAGPVVLIPGITVEVPLGREAGCAPTAGGTPGGWLFTLEGTAVRVVPRGCAYARPVKGRLRGLVSN